MRTQHHIEMHSGAPGNLCVIDGTYILVDDFSVIIWWVLVWLILVSTTSSGVVDSSVNNHKNPILVDDFSVVIWWVLFIDEITRDSF